MTNCNECKNLDITNEKEDGFKIVKHTCWRHKIILRESDKRFKGYIWPCDKCEEGDFEPFSIDKSSK